LWIVADDLHHLVRFSNDGNLSGIGYRIFSGEMPDDLKKRKRIKPDTECLIQLPTRPEGLSMLAFPSGSKSNRVLAKSRLARMMSSSPRTRSTSLHFYGS
jgi:hypothetical protein